MLVIIGVECLIWYMGLGVGVVVLGLWLKFDCHWWFRVLGCWWWVRVLDGGW